MKHLIAGAVLGAMVYVSTGRTLWVALVFGFGGWLCSWAAPKPRRPPGSARAALERLFWITGHDRIRTRDPRILWYGPPSRPK